MSQNPGLSAWSRGKEGGLEEQFCCGLMLKLEAPEGSALINTAVESKMAPERKRYFYLYLFSFLLYLFIFYLPLRALVVRNRLPWVVFTYCLPLLDRNSVKRNSFNKS